MCNITLYYYNIIRQKLHISISVDFFNHNESKWHQFYKYWIIHIYFYCLSYWGLAIIKAICKKGSNLVDCLTISSIFIFMTHYSILFKGSICAIVCNIAHRQHNILILCNIFQMVFAWHNLRILSVDILGGVILVYLDMLISRFP